MTVWIAGLVTLVGTVAIILIGWFVATRQPTEAPEQVLARVYRVRLKYFIGLSIVVVLALAFTLSQLPYPAGAGAEPSLRVQVFGSMWAWHFEPAPDAEGVLNVDGRLIVPVGQPVTFEVTAEDVNHGFGVYDQSGRLLGQTQVMPGYVNRLTLQFPEPGDYQVLCLEYCGVAHHVMATSIEAKAFPPAESLPKSLQTATEADATGSNP